MQWNGVPCEAQSHREPCTTSDPCLPAEGLGKPITLEGVEPTDSLCRQSQDALVDSRQTGDKACLASSANPDILEQANCYPNTQSAPSYRAGDRNLLETMN